MGATSLATSAHCSSYRFEDEADGEDDDGDDDDDDHDDDDDADACAAGGDRFDDGVSGGDDAPVCRGIVTFESSSSPPPPPPSSSSSCPRDPPPPPRPSPPPPPPPRPTSPPPPPPRPTSPPPPPSRHSYAPQPHTPHPAPHPHRVVLMNCRFAGHPDVPRLPAHEARRFDLGAGERGGTALECGHLRAEGFVNIVSMFRFSMGSRSASIFGTSTSPPS